MLIYLSKPRRTNDLGNALLLYHPAPATLSTDSLLSFPLITMLRNTRVQAALVALIGCAAAATAQSLPYAPTCPYGGSDVIELQRAIKANYTTCVEIISTYLNRAKAYNGNLKAFISLQEASALRQAADLDAFFQCEMFPLASGGMAAHRDRE